MILKLNFNKKIKSKKEKENRKMACGEGGSDGLDLDGLGG